MSNADKISSIRLREYKPESDKNFVFATFLRGLYYGESWFSLIPKRIFMNAYHQILENITTRPGVKILVACLAEDPDVILGYSVFHKVNENVVLDFVFVKSSWRRIGIGKSLIPSGVVACTHLTKIGKSLKPANIDFNPFA